ncbi:hypothetical protein [Streptomyces qinzhouensis]|uniref:hypothetical protein n=1 Tax=Streptomyces qinzhouensis TaxID=2599401 RepID=UPI00164412D1|nr:hypothetical protein [Streptomyces qinzhouensis]
MEELGGAAVRTVAWLGRNVLDILNAMTTISSLKEDYDRGRRRARRRRAAR